MGFFNRNKFNSKSEKLRIINEIELLQEKLNEQGDYKISKELNNISNILDNDRLKITKENIEFIDENLMDISNFPGKYYDMFLLNKCNQIKNLLKNKEYSNAEKKEIGILNELYMVQGELNELINDKINIEKRMDLALGKDPITWEMLNSKHKAVLKRMQIKSDRYKILLKSQGNIELAEEVRISKEQSKEIVDSMNIAEIRDFEDNAEYTTEIKNEIYETSDKLDSIFTKNFGGESGSSEYEKALEDKLLKEANSNNKKKLKKI